jgi:hypothetical protein
MTNYKNINSLDALEKEVHLLELEAKVIEEKLNRNFNHLQENCLSMTFNSIFSTKGKTSGTKKSFWKRFVNTDGFNDAVETFSESVATKAGDVFSDIAEKFLHKKQR